MAAHPPTPPPSSRAVLPAGISLQDAGLHTVSFAWRLDEADLWAELTAKHRSGALKTRGNPWRVINRPVGEMRWMYDLEHRMLACESPLTTMLGRQDGLAAPRELPQAALNAARRFADEVGSFPLDVPSRVRRVDYTVDLRMSTNLARSAIRRVTEAEASRSGDARSYSDSLGNKSSALTLAGNRRFAAYDRELKKGRAPGPFTTLRLELQHRPDKDRQRPTEAVARADAGARFRDHILGAVSDLPPLLEVTDAMDVIIQQSGHSIDPTVASRLAGDAFAVEQLGRARWPCARTARRGLQQLREAGLGIVDVGTQMYCRPSQPIFLTDLVSTASDALTTVS